VTERPAVSEHDNDHQLPGLIDWGDALLDATTRAEQDRVGRRRRRRRRRAIPALAAVGVLAVPGAVVATRSIWDDPVAPVTLKEDPSSPAIRLADGRSGDAVWQVGGWNSGERVCLRTEVRRGAGRPSTVTGCGTPAGRAALTLMPVVPGTPTVIAGTTSDAVDAVRVTPPAGAAQRVATVAIPAENLRRSGLKRATRIYVAVFPQGFASATTPPVVEAFDAGGAEVGGLGEAGR
jgi:hypothetical protein